VTPEPPVILFDGVCHLCNGAVRFTLRHDHEKRFLFAPLQSAPARALLARHEAGGRLPDSIVLVDADGLHTRSEAVLRIARRLRFPWRLLVAGRLMPRPMRDRVYDLVAGRRYRWFGKRDTCMVPTDEVRDRFLG
jgi:predicted DCC family thiol-disulfide oxidoreductase YuxK